MSSKALSDLDGLLEKVHKDLQAFLNDKNIDSPFFIGIHSGGAWLGELLHRRLGVKSPFGTLNITFYRDDFEQKGLHPEVKPSEIGASVDDQHIILIDDVVMTGRTIRAALNEIFDYGRPASVTLVSLVELDGQQLPIRSDICGQRLSLPESQRVELSGPQPLELKIVEYKDKG